MTWTRESASIKRPQVHHLLDQDTAALVPQMLLDEAETLEILISFRTTDASIVSQVRLSWFRQFVASVLFFLFFLLGHHCVKRKTQTRGSHLSRACLIKDLGEVNESSPEGLD